MYNVMNNRKYSYCNHLQINDAVVTSDNEKCELFRNFYTSVYAENTPEHPVADLHSTISDCLARIPQSITFLRVFKLDR